MQNLRNKYHNHPVIKPIIEHCDQNNLGFEFMKETRKAFFCIKSIRYINSYYMKIGDNLVASECNLWHWTDLFKLIINAYSQLGLEYPDNLIKAAKTFNKQI